jgi:hypothetical protein
MHDNLVEHLRACNCGIVARVVHDDNKIDDFLRDYFAPRLFNRPLGVICRHNDYYLLS